MKTFQWRSLLLSLFFLAFFFLESVFSEEPSNWLEEAKTAYAASDYVKAIEIFKAILKSGDEKAAHEQIYFLMGECYFYSKDYREAVKVLQRALKKYPKTQLKSEILYNLAWSYWRLDKRQEAFAYFQMVVKAYSMRSLKKELYYWMGEIKYENDNYREAIQNFEIVFNMPPKDEWSEYAKYNIAWCQFSLGKYRDAKKSFEELVRISWNRDLKADAYYKIATCYYNLKQYNTAFNVFLNVWSEFRESRWADRSLFQAGLCKIKLEEYEESQRTFQTLIQESTRGILNDEAAFMRGWIYYRAHQFVKALELFSRFPDEFPESNLLDFVRIHEAETLFNLSRYEDAAQKYQFIIENDPGSEDRSDAYFGFIWALIKKGKIEKAREVLQDFAQKEKEGHVSLDYLKFWFAQHDFSEEQHARAEEGFRDVIQGSSDKSLVWRSKLLLGKLLIKNQKSREGVSLLNNVLKKNEDDSLSAQAVVALALYYEKQGKWKKAIKVFRNFVAEVTHEEYRYLALKNMADLYFDNQKYDNAIKTLDQILMERFGSHVEEIQYTLALAHMMEGHQKKSLEIVQGLIAEYPLSGDYGLKAMYLLGKFYETSGLDQEAFQVYQGIVDVSPEEKEGYAGQWLKENS
ncbi:tetratricopeptide repeat protein [PVC group bacterium]|nr:tetratricopeptide repeat protein [PVC group bacterium]